MEILDISNEEVDLILNHVCYIRRIYGFKEKIVFGVFMSNGNHIPVSPLTWARIKVELGDTGADEIK